MSQFNAETFWYQFNLETEKMHPSETGNIVDGVYAIKNDFVNMYLIKDGDNYIAIDTGKDLEVISTELKKLNIDADKVVAVLLTHTDMDHVAGLPLFNNAKIYFSKNEVMMLTGEKQKIPGYSNSISRKDYTLLEDKQTLIIGKVKVFCILTEGHSSGSMCYQVNEKYLFSGDILSLEAGNLGSPVAFFDLNHEMARKSISKITHLPNVEYLFSAHHGFTKDYKNAVKDWKD
jgi:glyoxylase-like metal-dependent hydrolase (beta-lactamase superfamily II)